ncbi:MAG: LysR family transcriptional regulator [Candidatus Omnitrophica bacterium]|nr:LysR family transcriptional regulator [Candidatus Omnitrophota bacterium]
MIRSLQIFRDVVESRSFTEAARRNYLTQSAVSQHLKMLERHFGSSLIERGNRLIGLTPAGRLVYDAALGILKQYAHLEGQLKKPPREVSGTLRVAATLSIGLHDLPPYVTVFMKQYPKIDVQLAYLKAPQVYEAVLTERADLGVAGAPEPHPQLKALLFKKDRLVLIVPSGHPWSKQRRISLSRLDGQPFIALQKGSLIRRTLDRVLRRRGVRVEVIYEFDNIELIKRAVEVGVGLSIVPRGTAVQEAQAGSLKLLEIAEGPLEYPMKILTRKYGERSLPAQQFINSLLSSSR